MLRHDGRHGEISVLIITTSFREVMSFADEVTVLRRGRLAGGERCAQPWDAGRARHYEPAAMAR